MRLTAILRMYPKGHNKWPRGNVWLGKHRIVPPTGLGVKGTALKRLLWEYENMRILAKPYLTAEEEASQPDWTAEQEKLEAHIAERSDLKFKFFKGQRSFQHNSIEEHLSHLNCSKNWY